MKLLIILFLTALCPYITGHPAIAGGVGGSANPVGPAILFDYDEVDWGLIGEGDPIAMDFSFKNIGSAPLLISNIKTSCGRCTAVSLGSYTIAPGERSRIAVKVNTTGLKGLANYNVILYSNDPRNLAYNLKLRFQVLPEIEIMPSLIRFAKPISAGDTPTTFSIRSMSKRLSKLTVASDDNALFDVMVIKRSVYDNAKILKNTRTSSEKRIPCAKDDKVCGFVLSCRLKPNASAGVFCKNIKLASDNKKTPIFFVPISGEVVSSINLKPHEITFIVKKGATSVAQQALLQTAGAQTRIISINTDIKGLTFKSTSVTGGHLITATLDAKAAPKIFEGKAIIQTDYPDKVIELTIKGLRL